MAHHVPRPDHPVRPIDRMIGPIVRFTRFEAAGGILLLIGTIAALIWANSPWSESYDQFWHTNVKMEFGGGAQAHGEAGPVGEAAHSAGAGAPDADSAADPNGHAAGGAEALQPHDPLYKGEDGGWVLEMSLAHFVNDGLMAIFFFVVGLEIKREMLVGQLASRRKAAIPIAAAIGGMVVPALIYVAIAGRGDAMRGWAIPMATDIAFAVGIMAMLGSRVPTSIKVFVTALAIADDIGAVVVIAFFYTSNLSFLALGVATALIVLSAVANRAGVRSALVYGLLGSVMWLMLLKSGVHATIGGVLLAFTIPAKVRIDGAMFSRFARQSIDNFDGAGGAHENILTSTDRQGIVQGLEQACENVQTPLNRLEHGLHPWVSFLIMPVFALANAGVALGSDVFGHLTSGIGLGIALGLLIGKPVGVMLATWIAIKVGLGAMPEGSTWRQLLGAGLLAGIGFTMSLFIANLGFPAGIHPDQLLTAKMGILAGSLISGTIGFILLRRGGAAGSATPASDPASGSTSSSA